MLFIIDLMIPHNGMNSINEVYYVHFKEKGKTLPLPRHHAMEVNRVNAIKVQVADNVILNTISTNVLLKISPH